MEEGGSASDRGRFVACISASVQIYYNMFALIPPTADTDTLLCIVDTLLQVQCAYNIFALIPPAADRDTTETSVRTNSHRKSLKPR